MSLHKKMERSRRESVNATILAIAVWLEEHAKGKRIDFYCPSKSGNAACLNAAAVLKAHALGRTLPQNYQASQLVPEEPEAA